MNSLALLLLLPFGALAVSNKIDARATSNGCTPFGPALEEFSSSFQQPVPPLIHADFSAQFIQHKWNSNLSHITAGYLTMSHAKQYVQANEAFDGGLASSVFNYANMSNGLVDNTMVTYSGNSTASDVWQGYVNPGEPLIEPDILVNNSAVFGGLVSTRFNPDRVATWDILYQGEIPLTVYVNDCDIIVRYDFYSPILRTRAITELFDITIST